MQDREHISARENVICEETLRLLIVDKNQPHLAKEEIDDIMLAPVVRAGR